MDYRTFDVNITSAEGAEGALNFVNFFSRMRVYAIVSVVGNPPCRLQSQETPLANYFGKNPVWNFQARFHVEDPKLQQNALTLKIQLRKKRMFGEDEAIGEACVPIKQLFNCNDNVMATNYSYSWLLSPAGGRRGVVFFSFNFSKTYRATPKSDGLVVAPPAESEPAEARRRTRPSAPSYYF